MTNEEKLRNQLKAAMIALVRIQGKTFDLSYLVEEEGLDVQHAFDSLIDWITITSVKEQKALELVEEEYKEANDDSKA